MVTDPSSPSVDSFSRFRVSSPHTEFDSKQLHDNLPLLFDDQETSGSGTSSTHSTATAQSSLQVSATTAGTRVRQTFRRFNYQPGKSQYIILTGCLPDGAAIVRDSTISGNGTSTETFAQLEELHNYEVTTDFA